MHGRAQTAQVVVVADAVDGHAPAVDQHAAVLGELDGADAEIGGDEIGRLAADSHVRGGAIQLRRVGRPEFRLAHGDRFHEGRFAAGGDDPLGRLGAGAQDLAVGPDDLGPELHLGRRRALVFHAGGDFHFGRIGRDRRRGDIGSPVGHVDGLEHLQPHVAENAGPGVPAAARLRDIDPHG